jgi:hypothetical protein
MDVQKLARLVTSEISAGKYSQSQATEIVRRVRLLDAKETSAKPPSKPSSPRAAKNGDDDSDLELAGDDDDEEGRGGKGTKAKPLPVEPKRRSSLSSGGPGALAEPDVPFKVRFFTAIPPHVLSKIGVDAAGYVVLLPLEMSSSTGQPANWAQGLQPGDRIVSVEHRKVDPLPPAPSRSSTASMFMGGSAASKQQKREKAKVESVCDQIRKAEGAVAGGGYAITFVRPSDSTKTTTAAAASTARAADNGKAATAPTAKRKPRNSIFAGFISSSSGKSDSPSEVLEADTAAAAPAEEEDPLEAQSQNYLPPKDGKDDSDPLKLLANARAALAESSTSSKVYSWEASMDGLTALRRVAVRGPQHLTEEVVADCAKELETCCRSIR